MVQNFRDGPKWVCGVVIKRKGPVTYLVQVENGTVWKRHVDHVRSRGRVDKSDALLPVGQDTRVQDTDSSDNGPMDTDLDSGNDTTNHAESTEQQSISPQESRVVRHSYPRREHKAPDRYM